ncbi:MAG: flagellar filament capping protein FliD [Synergistaceae bacterium]|jgi:flagellar hook-associated protein 2|nr:flagellar filament capping protein FliD [Synergistaceae bacterium]
MADSLFQVTGLASGISWDEIITKTLDAARAPAETWQKTIDTLTYKKSLYEELNSAILKLRGTLTTLRLGSTFKSKLSELTIRSAGDTFTDPYGTTKIKAQDPNSVLKVTANADATVSQWRIDVASVAQAQKKYSTNRFSSVETQIGITGSFDVHVGSQTATISVVATDTVTTINQKISTARDQNGDKLKMTSQLIDNRFVFENTTTGTNKGNEISATISTNLTEDTWSLGQYFTDLPTSASGGPFPPALYSVSSGTTTYAAGTDYNYSNGRITWLVPPGTHPAEGDDLTIVYGQANTVTSYTPTSGVAVPLTLPPAVTYTSSTHTVEVKDSAGNIIPQSDYTFNPGVPEIVWAANLPTDNYTVTVTQAVTGVPINYVADSNNFYFDNEFGIGVLNFFGLNAADLTNVAARDAILYLDGMEIVRSSNIIDDLIPNVKLELVGGVGDVTVNITQDTQKAIDAVQAYTDAYNEVLEWINEKLTEKYTTTNVDADDDYLQGLLAASKGSTVFGTLHGDQLLWSIKNQLRNSLANPITLMARGLATKNYLHTNTDLNIQGAFYLYVGGQAAKIQIDNGDTLERIRDKIADATIMTSKSDGTAAVGTLMNLDVFIRNGQLVVNYNSAATVTNPIDIYVTRQHDPALAVGSPPYPDCDLLPFTPTTAAPVSGKLTVLQGSYSTDAAGNVIEPKFYQEGVDFDILTEEDSGALKSYIQWKGTNRPAVGATYRVGYDYNPYAVAYSTAPYAGTILSTSDDLSALGFHTDQSAAQLSTFGLSTGTSAGVYDATAVSGILEFDPDKLYAAIIADSANTANVMTAYFKDMDAYITSLVSSAQTVVAGTAVTTGRIAGAVLSIDVQVEDLQTRIQKLETQLAARQVSMYKQYSDMEQAIQKLNAQMSSVSQYFANTASS